MLRVGQSAARGGADGAAASTVLQHTHTCAPRAWRRPGLLWRTRGPPTSAPTPVMAHRPHCGRLERARSSLERTSATRVLCCFSRAQEPAARAHGRRCRVRPAAERSAPASASHECKNCHEHRPTTSSGAELRAHEGVKRLAQPCRLCFEAGFAYSTNLKATLNPRQACPCARPFCYTLGIFRRTSRAISTVTRESELKGCARALGHALSSREQMRGCTSIESIVLMCSADGLAMLTPSGCSQTPYSAVNKLAQLSNRLRTNAPTRTSALPLNAY